jgi:aspartyl-tRNA(Asn)/glutamyl-tRNA(Gln) amidotransferase subunit A
MTIKELHKKLVQKEISPVELTKNYLNKINSEDKKIKSFITVCDKEALEQAKESEKIIDQQGDKSPLLCGIPCAIKDNIQIENIKCTASSKILENYISPYNATVIEKLKDQGAIFLGKTNMDEFAMGSSTENSAFFTTKNPHDSTRVPGGSSGGSAAAVAADFCQYALGSDTGGSIRQPASFCGVVGLKPTYGAVSRYGLIAMASSLDQIGPLTKNVEDSKIVFDAIKGKDKKDSTSIKSMPDKEKCISEKLTIGIPKEYFGEGIDKEVKESIQSSIDNLKKQGATIKQISLPYTEYALAVYYLIMPSEVSANLARYDGIKFGMSAANEPDIKDLFEVYSKTRGKYLGKEVKRRIILGTFALSAGYYDEYYKKAQKVRTLIKKNFEKAFNSVNIILTPTAPTVAFKIGEKINDPLKMYLSDIFTVAPSLAGIAAITVPSKTKKTKLPIGIQLMASPFNENILFETASLI